VGCAEVIDFICTNFGEEEDSERCRAVRAHLKECPDCTTYCNSFEKMIALYRSTAPSFSEEARAELLTLLGVRGGADAA
jgi:anti-sigma factor RsiW